MGLHTGLLRDFYGVQLGATAGATGPICLELVENSTDLGIPKQEGSKPGHTVGKKLSSTRAVERWR